MSFTPCPYQIWILVNLITKIKYYVRGRVEHWIITLCTYDNLKLDYDNLSKDNSQKS